MEMDREQASNTRAQALFPGVTLPRLEELPDYQRSAQFMATLLLLPGIAAENPARRQLGRQRGAPVKPKNMLVRLLNFKNTRGKKFKFSFIPQILVSHLQHLVGNKQRTRNNCEDWLRSHTQEGLGLQILIREAVGPDATILRFKRTVSMQELKEWLDGLSYCRGFQREELSAVRHRVFRLFCVLKSIGIESYYSADFNVETTCPSGGQVFRWYITQFLWEELEQPELTQEEISAAIQCGLSRVRLQ